MLYFAHLTPLAILGFRWPEVFPWLAAWNALVALLFAYDKHQAVANSARIPEKLLLLTTLSCGSAGAGVARGLWRHKTLHARFTLAIVVGHLLTLALAFY